MNNDVERRTRFSSIACLSPSYLTWNRGIPVVLLLCHLKKIPQRPQHGKTVKERIRTSLSLTTARLAQTRTPQMSPMKNNSNDCKTQTGKRSIYFLWQVPFTSRNFVTWFLKRINELNMTTKVSCHSLCDGIVLPVFSCGDIHSINVWNISRLECVCVLIWFCSTA